MAVNIKLGVDMSSFKSGIQEANAQLKTFDAQLKFAETTFKKTGDAEAAMATKTDALSNKLKVQKQVVQQYEKALEDMRKNNVDPTSKSYQQMQAAMLNMQSAANETEIALNGLSASQLNAATSADKLNNSVSSIGKKMSLSQVIGGIDKITSGLENAAKKAVQLGEELWNNVMSRAQWADDTATAALMYGIDLDTYMRMQKLVTNGLDTSVDAILTSQSKLKRGIGSDAKAVSEALATMGISMTNTIYGGKYPIEQAKDSLELFWEVGQKLMTWGDEYQKEDMAQKLFGRGWKELVPLFSQYKSIDEYNAALKEVNVSSEEDINALAELNDKVGELKGNLEQLSTDILAQLAPALTEGAEALNGVLSSILEYLRTPAGQEALGKLGDAISGLFGDLSKIDPEKVVNGFVEVFTKVTDGIQWLVDNKETAKGILGAIVGGWGALTIGANVLKVINFIDGIKGLSGAAAGAEGAAAGASWGTAFASAVIKAAPWLIGIYELVKPSASLDNSLMNADGTLTQEGYYEFARQAMETLDYKSFLMELGTYLGSGGMASLMGNAAAVTDIWNYLISGKAGYNTQGFVNNVLGKYTGMQFGSDWLGVAFSEEDLNAILQGMDLSLTPKFIIPENEAEQISDAIGTVQVPVELVVHKEHRGGWTGFDVNPDGSNANGLPFVPYDGYLSLLHRGERVLTASENRHYTYNSNTYFGSVNLNNGLQVEALAESIARNNRRKNSGYGS